MDSVVKSGKKHGKKGGGVGKNYETIAKESEEKECEQVEAWEKMK